MRLGAAPGPVLGAGLFLVLAAPLVALLVSSTPAELLRALSHPLVAPALWLSAWTTALSLFIVVVCGAPLAWLFARSRVSWVRLVETCVELPIVVPPAVVGIALLQAFGRRGLFGSSFEAFGVALPFTSAAVVVAQVVVSAPFFVQTAAAGFRRVDEDMLLVARTLGATPERAFFRVAVPVALPSLLGGAALCWARSLGEFGATLLFAGNFPGRTQTLPLAIYSALESDVGVARAIALILGVVAFATLLVLRALPKLLARRRKQARNAARTSLEDVS
jgi:molybdate transport system permease protein